MTDRQQPEFRIGDRPIGPGRPCYVIAELSANHGHDYQRALDTVHAAAEAGVDAVKLQTYTADTLTIPCNNKYFRITGGTPWDGRTLHELYQQAYTPWQWQPRLKEAADSLKLPLFSTPFDASAVDLLEQMNVPAHKIASFELVDHSLLECVARTGKPVILSTGMASFLEIAEAVAVLRRHGCRQLALLKCTSAYPAPPEEMNLATIGHLAASFGVVAGLSDHTLENTSAITAVALGASIVEKHFTLSRKEQGPDSAFSLEPQEMAELVRAIRTAEAARGEVCYEITEKQQASRAFRRSLFIVRDVQAGQVLSSEHVRSIRPGHGLPPKYLPQILGRRAACDLAAGTPVGWDLLA